MIQHVSILLHRFNTFTSSLRSFGFQSMGKRETAYHTLSHSLIPIQNKRSPKGGSCLPTLRTVVTQINYFHIKTWLQIHFLTINWQGQYQRMPSYSSPYFWIQTPESSYTHVKIATLKLGICHMTKLYVEFMYCSFLDRYILGVKRELTLV